jgi:hypothetical protein
MNTETVTNKLNIRRARLDDIPTLQELIPLAYRVLGAGHFSRQQIESGLEFVVGVDTQMIEDGTYYVAEIDEQIRRWRRLVQANETIR